MSEIRIDDIRRQLLDIGRMDKPGQQAEPEKSFNDVLSDAVTKVNAEQVEAQEKIGQYVSGTGPSLHETLISLEKADVSFRMMMQVRNKLMDAYTEIMRTQV
jgi:flagellar hook-basal body complex protein FliE